MKVLSDQKIRNVSGGFLAKYVALPLIAVYLHWDKIKAASAMVNPGGGDDLRP